MSRNEGKIGTGDEAPVNAADIFAQLEAEAARHRFAAVARYLSASEGWREALAQLGGAFAAAPRDEPDRATAGGNKGDINHQT